VPGSATPCNRENCLKYNGLKIRQRPVVVRQWESHSQKRSDPEGVTTVARRSRYYMKTSLRRQRAKSDPVQGCFSILGSCEAGGTNSNTGYRSAILMNSLDSEPTGIGK